MRILTTSLISAVVLCLATAFETRHAQADSNRIYLLQVNPASGTGNEMSVSQSNARLSTVRGHPTLFENPLTNERTATDAALQFGQGNKAHVEIAGFASIARVTQTGARFRGRPLAGDNNTAELILSGNLQSASVLQRGHHNHAALNLGRGDRADGSIRQTGNHNSAVVNIQGRDLRGVVRQTGNNLNSGLTLHRSSPGSHVEYTVHGTGNAGNSHIAVSTNAGPIGVVQVTQYR